MGLKVYYTEIVDGTRRLVEHPDGWEAVERYLLEHRWLLLSYAADLFGEEDWEEESVVEELLNSVRTERLNSSVLVWFPITLVFETPEGVVNRGISEYPEASRWYGEPSAIILGDPFAVLDPPS